MRKKLRDKIREAYDTQDKCAYALKIDNGLLSRIVNCTKDPSALHIKILSKALGLSAKEVIEKECLK